MILGFKQKFDSGTETKFKEKIYAGLAIKQNTFYPASEIKIHSMRAGERWKAGNSIQMAYGVRTKKYKQFNKAAKYKKLQKCISVQKVLMGLTDDELVIVVDGNFLNPSMTDMLISNDGLTHTQFINWFFPNGAGKWKGQIIHWTNFKY